MASRSPTYTYWRGNGFIMSLDPFCTTNLADELVKMKVKMKTKG